jgi:outer membrane protein insertion porin family
VEETEILARSGTVPLFNVQQEIDKGLQQTRSIGFNVTRNTTDKFIDPSRGTVQTGSVEYAGGPMGGDSDFVKYYLNAKAFYPVTATTVFSWNVLWAHVVPTVSGEEIPLFERFFLGGPYSIRGFRSRELSPRDPNTGEEIGGNKELIGNLEYLFPLVPEIAFKGVFFFDIGNAWEQGAWPWDGRQLRYAAGAGVRWYSPMGPLRFEMGWNLKPGPGEPRRVMEFTIGTAF